MLDFDNLFSIYNILSITFNETNHFFCNTVIIINEKQACTVIFAMNFLIYCSPCSNSVSEMTL